MCLRFVLSAIPICSFTQVRFKFGLLCCAAPWPTMEPSALGKSFVTRFRRLWCLAGCGGLAALSPGRAWGPGVRMVRGSLGVLVGGPWRVLRCPRRVDFGTIGRGGGDRWTCKECASKTIRTHTAQESHPRPPLSERVLRHGDCARNASLGIWKRVSSRYANRSNDARCIQMFHKTTPTRCDRKSFLLSS